MLRFERGTGAKRYQDINTKCYDLKGEGGGWKVGVGVGGME